MVLFLKFVWFLLKKWKMDGAELIFEDALKKHVGMINEFKGLNNV